MKQNFSSSNPNFWARLLIFAFSVIALLGVQIPESPAMLTDKIVTTISGGSAYAVIGILIVSVLMPIINFVRSKPKLDLYAIIGSPNFWIYFASFVLGCLVLLGIDIPDGTAEQLVGAIFAKDWGGLATVAFVNLADPFIRWWRDKRQTSVTA
jgi:hypothetical protein